MGPETEPHPPPIIPIQAVPWIAATVGAAASIGTALPQHTVLARVLNAIALIGGSILGILSPGWRKRDAE